MGCGGYTEESIGYSKRIITVRGMTMKKTIPIILLMTGLLMALTACLEDTVDDSEKTGLILQAMGTEGISQSPILTTISST